jgi:capsular exopolysaccharide synthesis family protein
MTDRPPTAPTPPDEQDPIVDLADVWDSIRAGRWLLVGATMLGLAAAAVASAWLPPSYRSEAVIRISTESAGQRLLGELGPLARLTGLGGGDGIDTDIALLRSRQIAETVVDSLSLQVQLLQPAQPRDSVFAQLRARRDAIGGSYVMRLQGDGSYAAEVFDNREPVTLPARIPIGTPVSFGGLTLTLDPLLRAAPPERIRFVVLPYVDAVEQLRGDMRVGLADGRSRMVEVRYSSRDPMLAAAVPNLTAQSFIAYKTGSSKSEAVSTIEVLREQIARYEEQLRLAEERLRNFREQQQVVSLPEQASQQVRRMAEIQAGRDGLQVERESLGKLLAAVNRGRQQVDGPSPYRQLATFPSFISNRAVQDILHSLIQLENERANLLIRRTPESVDVRGITERIGELETQLYQLANNYLTSLDNQIGSATSVLAGFGPEIGRIPAREVEFLRLMRDQKVLEEVYTFLQTRLKEAEIQGAVEPGDVRMVDPALVPRRPDSPRPMVNLALGAILGLMLGTTLAVGRRAMDRRIRSRKDAVLAAGGLPLLGVIPVLDDARQARLPGVAQPDRRADAAHPLLMRDAADTLAGEAYRAVRTHLRIAAAERDERVVVIASPSSGEGKSNTAANLALSLAQQGSPTLLVDADARRGGHLHEWFAEASGPGLVDVLQGRASLDEAIRSVPAGGGETLHCLFCGSAAAGAAELLGSDRMRRLIAELRERYGMVILDTPPLDLVTDAAVLGRSADATLLVVRADSTEPDAVREALSLLASLGVTTRGLILNGFAGEVRGRSYLRKQRRVRAWSVRRPALLSSSTDT